MKIAALLPHVEIFGGVRRYLEIGNEFIKRGHQFILYHSDGSSVDWFNFLGEIKPIGLAEKDNFDIVLCSEYSILNYFQKVRAKKKVFYFILEKHKMEKEICRQGYIFLGNSIGLCRRIEKKYGQKCFHAPGGINPDIFYPIEVPNKNNKLRIICYGRIYKKRKGVEKIIRVVDRLYRKYKFLELILFDTPVGKEKIDPRRMVSPKVPFKFYLNLPQKKMAWLYSQGEIFVSAEKRAGWSNTTAEAMACRLAVVCTKSGTEDFAVNNQTALLVPFNNSFFISQKVEKLIRDKDLRRNIAQKGYLKIQQFTWSKLVDGLEEFFRELVP
ncbi:MAG: glycosyltransferase family 4 protein [Candidatus Aminicenantia bacterium]